MQNTYSCLGLGVAIVVLIGGGIFFINKKNGGAAGTVSTTTPASTTNITSDLGNGVSVTGPGKVELIDTSVPPPSLTGAISISPSLSADVRAALEAKEQALIVELKKDGARVDLWLSLGVYRKIAGDYTGAITAWNYVAAVGPASINYIAYGNLGDLYMNFQVNYPKAESNYKKAIAIKPTVIEYYRGLYTLYRYDYKVGTSAAADILAQGLKANPNNPDLLQLQQQLQAKAQ